jgi:uncharacterized protein (DUF2141 family)
MKTLISAMAISTIFFLSHKIQSQANALTVDITNIKDLKGDIHVQLFNQHQQFPKPPFSSEIIIKPNGKNKVSANFPGVDNGSYAILVYQDSNSNGKFDRNFIGIPNEPYALSQNFHPKMSSPTFEECKVAFGPNKTAFSLEMNN